MLGKIGGWWRRRRQKMRWLDGIINLMDEFEQTLGDVEGQGSLSFFSPWGSKESDMTEWLSNNKNNNQLNKNGLSRMCSL